MESLTEIASAERIDEPAGVRERAAFLGGAGLEMFAVLHEPVGRLLGATVICCPVESEMERNYRREVLLARDLAARGVAVARFHYRGAGHSQGSPHHLTFDSMREDASAAAEWLAGRTGVDPAVFVGTRLGALVAAAAATDRPGAAVVLWEPVVSARQYFREVFRTPLVLGLKDGDGTLWGEAAERRLASEGMVDILGYPVHRELRESFTPHTLQGLLGAEGQRCLLVQLGRGEKLRREYAKFRDLSVERGLALEAATVDSPTVWWVDAGEWTPEEWRPGTDQLVSVTADWIIGRLAEGGS